MGISVIELLTRVAGVLCSIPGPVNVYLHFINMVIPPFLLHHQAFKSYKKNNNFLRIVDKHIQAFYSLQKRFTRGGFSKAGVRKL